ncbi:uncharacterized protein LOC129219562 [Uloborus diversus]|uniref:uncharacterized protein LOC129219562 n=1 Tax=Uloborus diversus TaxID=327109 RepID=UPI00240939B1|nr:uncharacterized protein LOC129219562 [Uloborus diversus]
MRPQHLHHNRPSTPILEKPLKTTKFVPLDEEYFIRQYCPVTLNHLLPDLQLTYLKTRSDGALEYEEDLKSKFEKHLDESHRQISCCSSTESESESKEEEDFADKIQNDLNSSRISSNNSKNSIKHLLLPNKVNYPDEKMPESLFPEVILNNSKSKVLPIKLTNLSEIDKQKEEQQHVTDCFEALEGSTVKHSLSRNGQQISISPPIFLKEYTAGWNKNSSSIRCSRSKSTPPSIPRHYSDVPCHEEDRIIPPSPYLGLLANLKRDCLKMEEKMLLKERQILEVERLRPPAKRWYEMKNQQFHREMQRHNVYLNNEKILPLIEERRKQLYDALMT